MTVGISITNGLEAVVLTDSRGSGANRQSDSLEKMQVLKKAGYHGVMCASGIKPAFDHAARLIESEPEKNLDDYLL